MGAKTVIPEIFCNITYSRYDVFSNMFQTSLPCTRGNLRNKQLRASDVRTEDFREAAMKIIVSLDLTQHNNILEKPCISIFRIQDNYFQVHHGVILKSCRASSTGKLCPGTLFHPKDGGCRFP
jgi:hypothetical protein